MRDYTYLLKRLFTTSLCLRKHYQPFFDPMKPPPHINLTVLGTGHRYGPTSFVIDTGVTRYLVNCGEGTQRILSEHRSKTSRMQHVFLTRMSWDHVSGLLGVALTARQAGVKTLTVHGPSKVGELMRLTRHFADCETTDIVTSNIIAQPFQDPAFKVHAFPVTTLFNNGDSTEPAPKRVKPDDLTPSTTTYVYYFQTYQPSRKVDREKCATLGVPRSIYESPVVRDLLDGKSITLANGIVIQPDEVTSPAPFTPNFLVVDCPTEDFILALSENEALFSTLRHKPEDERALHPGLSFVVHIVPQGMFSSEVYQKFVQKLTKVSTESFRPHELPACQLPSSQHVTHPIHHLVLDGSGCIPPLSGLYSQSTILHHFFDRDVYPLLYDCRSAHRLQEIHNAMSQTPDPHASVVYGQPRLQYRIRPWAGFTNPPYETLDSERLLDEAFDPLYVTREEAEIQFSKMLNSIPVNLLPKGKHSSTNHGAGGDAQATSVEDAYPEITFLGTASSSPNKYRNISCILVQLNPDDYIMLDCGEGSLNQLCALHGADGAANILRRLRLILITHMHVDHHGGVFTVALARSRALQSENLSDLDAGRPTLPILAPAAFARWMTSFGELFPHGPTISLYIIPRLYESCPPDLRPPICPLRADGPCVAEWTSLLESLKLEVYPIKVPHTSTSWAYKLCGQRFGSVNSEHTDTNKQNRPLNWSLVYSGDTPECADLAEAGRPCDLLIHEATMTDEHQDLADKTKHSTFGTAIRIGKEMEATSIMLTHFSQRYGRLPSIDEFRPNVAVAFDFLKFRFSDLPRLPYYVPYYKYAFGKHWDTVQAKTEAYSWRKIRQSQQQKVEDATATMTSIGGSVRAASQ
ncbi:hypothetical protein CRM22_002317 [Opisthorchis felineus]|uniref:ribonuclease Z n=3 Tax=Opisthorchis felineus TaxID=147828 RepID=A0A4S2M6M7_OPIFE|nr:hypothetical protein CRM22_002317 [Opisthorchis felineus]